MFLSEGPSQRQLDVPAFLPPLAQCTYRHAGDGRGVQDLEGQAGQIVRRGMSYSTGREEEKERQQAPKCVAREAPAPHDDDDDGDKGSARSLCGAM